MGRKKVANTRTRMKSCLRMRIPGKLVRTRASCACSNAEEVPMPISSSIQRDKTLLRAFILSFPPAPRQFSPAYLETPLLLSSSIVGSFFLDMKIRKKRIPSWRRKFPRPFNSPDASGSLLQPTSGDVATRYLVRNSTAASLRYFRPKNEKRSKGRYQPCQLSLSPRLFILPLSQKYLSLSRGYSATYQSDFPTFLAPFSRLLIFHFRAVCLFQKCHLPKQFDITSISM